jgi:RNA polymerase sigma-70 factor (ECF subfamily)
MSHEPSAGGQDLEIDEVRRALATGDQELLATIFERYRDRLRRMVRLRMDHRVQARIDPSDVIQEAYLEATKRLADYLKGPDMPFSLWLRFLTGQKLLQFHRLHLGTQARDPRLEVSIDSQGLPPSIASRLAEGLVDSTTSQCGKQARAELRAKMILVLESLDPIDREVIALRHFEQLTNGESARVLGIDPNAASQRYFRALKRLKEKMDAGKRP